MHGMRPRTSSLLAWALVALVLVSWVLALLLGGGRSSGQPVPAAAGPGGTGGPAGSGGVVVVVGVPGLTWDLVDEDTTPALWRLGMESASAALVLRGTHEVTCAPDAWLTLGAGQRAATDLSGCGDGPAAGGVTVQASAEVVRPVGDGAQVVAGRWAGWQAAADRRALGPHLGTLAELVREQGSCVAAYGPDAALGAARSPGRVAAYRDTGLADTGLRLDGACRLHLVSAPAVEEGDPSGQLTEIDAGLAQLREDLPEGSRLVVAGLGHTADRPDATVLMVGPSDWPGGAEEESLHLLTSASTQQRGLVQLTDLTTGLLQLLGQPTDDPRLAGGELQLVPSTSAEAALASTADLAQGVSVSKALVPWTLGALAALVLPALLVTALLRWWTVLAAVATVALAVPVAAFLVGLVPWWGMGVPWLVLIVGIVVLAGLLALAAWAGPWRRHPLGPPAVVAAVTLAVLGADVLASSRLGLVSVLGLEPVTAGRFYGQGNVGFGIVLGAYLVLAAAIVTFLAPARRGQAALAVGLLGAAATLVNAAPQGGADFGGVPALVIATGLMVMAALDVKRSFGTLAVLGVAGLVVAATVMLADWLRGPGSRTHLGDFVQSVLDGEALGIVTRKLDQSLGILVSYPVSWLAVLALVAFAWVALARPRWSAGLWRHEGVGPAATAGALTMALTWALNDSGIAAVALTLAVLLSAGVVLLASVGAGAASVRAGASGRPAAP